MSLGGALLFENNSIVTTINCSFVNNSAHSGSAIYKNNSKLFVSGLKTSIVNNTGIAPPVQVTSSQINVSHATFAGNLFSKYQAAMFLLESNISYYDVHILKTPTPTMSATQTARNLTMDECDVFVAADTNNYANKSSCLKFE
jgi:hypothetical protein